MIQLQQRKRKVIVAEDIYMAVLIVIGVVLLVGGVTAGPYLIQQGFQALNREEENLLGDNADEVVEHLISFLSGENEKNVREKIKEIAIKLHELRSESTASGKNELELDYVRNACMNPKNTMAITFSRKKSGQEKVYYGLMLASYRQDINNPEKLIVDIDVVLGLEGGGSEVIMPMTELKYTSLREMKYETVLFKLKAIDNEKVISFYEKCGFDFETGNNVENGLRAMYFEKQL